MKNSIAAVLFSLAIIVAAIVLGNAFMNRNKSEGFIAVTGSGNKDFSSDLIVWDGEFTRENTNLRQAYAELESDKRIISTYLAEKGVNEEDIVFNAVRTHKNMRGNYSPDGRYLGEEFLGYILTQSLTIESGEVDKIEKLSREITELLNQGVQFYSQPPRYYFTGLSDLKIEMISKATEDARVRAEQIAANSGAELGKLISADLGIFQITGQNSNEDFTWGGAFNTESREKTATVTVRLKYHVD